MSNPSTRGDQIAAGLDAVRRRIADAASASGRTADDVTLVVVTKFFPASDVRLLAGLGVTDVGVRTDDGRLVALQAADEVPAQAEVTALGELVTGLGVPVLAHVGHAEVGEDPDVARREELGDRYERDVTGGTTSPRRRIGDPAAYGVEPGGDVVVACHDAILMIPACRPERGPSRR